MSLCFPAEWSPHARLWSAWPSHSEYWEGQIELARSEISAFFQAHLAQEGNEPLSVFVDPSAWGSVPPALKSSSIDWVQEPIGDIWFRDIGPLFCQRDQHLVAVLFEQNGWGGKFVMPGDESIGQRIADRTELVSEKHRFVLEGGALDFDGNGTLLTTRQCLLNPNRNKVSSEAEVETILAESLGVRKTIWLDEGLFNDHTDGHIDNIARFIGPSKIAIMEPFGTDDPNAEVYDRIIRTLEGESDADGNLFELVRIPSPGRVSGHTGEIVPASHMNFLITNRNVFVPTYGTASADLAVSKLQFHFPDRRVIGLSARGVLAGGGAFHCMTQQEPLLS